MTMMKKVMKMRTMDEYKDSMKTLMKKRRRKTEEEKKETVMKMKNM